MGYAELNYKIIQKKQITGEIHKAFNRHSLKILSALTTRNPKNGSCLQITS